MTSLVVTPNVKRKTLKFEGRIAAGEHVLVRVETFDDKVGEGKSLRLRAVSPNGDTLAVFPPHVNDDDPPRPQEELVWQVDGGDATCVFDFNTVQAEKFLRCGGECLFVLDDVDNHTLYGNGFCTVAPWAKENGLDVPVDLDGYKDVGERVTVLEDEIASIGEKAEAASAEASSAKSTADSAARVAETARTDAVAAGNAAISAASSASEAQTGAAAASSAAGAAATSASDAAASAKSASDKFDALSDVAKSGRYEDLLDKPSIPSIAGLATKTELSREESRAKGVEQNILNRLARTPSLDDGGKVPASQLPSYVDDVIEYGDRTRFPAFGESGKIYVDMSTNRLYRWTGTVYVQIPSGLALGETASTAYPGDKGAANASDIANLKTSKQDALDARQLAAVNSGVTSEKVADMVAKSDVVPVGGGTEVIATIGGKDIKAPAAPVSSVNGKTGAVKLAAADVGALALGSSNKVGSSFSMGFDGEETSGGNLSFGVGMGPAGWTFVVNKFYCSGISSLYANGLVITNTSNEEGASVLARIQEYGGDFKSALQEVNGLIGEAMNGAATEEYVDGMAKYPVVQKSGTTVMLEDRKVNVYSGTLSSDVTLVLPAANSDGRVRDLEFRAEVSGLRLVGVRRTDASGATVALFSMSPGSVPAEEGVNAWYFTETGGEVRVERAMLKPAGFQVKMDFTCTSPFSHSNVVDFLDSAGNTIKSIEFKDQTLSEIVPGVSTIHINMTAYGYVVVDGTKYSNSVDIQLTGDSVITSSYADACLAPDTSILTPSGPVALKDIHVGDTVIGVDADGRVCTTTVTRCDTDMEKWADSCDRWTFVRENGDNVVVTTVMRHRFYNVERGAMVYMDEWNVGEHGRDPDGRVLELVSHEHVDAPTRHMTLFTGTQTYFAGGLLSGNRHTPYIDWEDR